MMTPIIDSGHGYNTPGKRSEFHYKDGIVLLKENSFNEAIANKLSMKFYSENKDIHFISNEWNDISLQERCNREHTFYKKGETIFISIHADAFTKKDKATGGTFFYNSESGKKLAEHFTNIFNEGNYPIKMRSPKQANFKVLRSTKSPAILFEAGFMTTTSDLNYLLDDGFRNLCTELLYKAITTVK